MTHGDAPGSTAPHAHATEAHVDHADHGYGRQTAHSPWWKGLFSTVLILAVWAILTTVFTVAAGPLGRAAGFTGAMNPATFAAINLSWGAMIFLSPLIMRLVHGLPQGRISSLDGGLRWPRIGRALLWVIPLYLASNALWIVFGPKVGNGVITPMLMVFMVVTILTSPLQAAGEEYTFRGGIFTSLGGWGSPRVGLVVGAVVSTLAFTALHGASDPLLIAFYLTFGLGALFVTRLTRGLELAIALHAVNNTLTFLVNCLRGFNPDVAGPSHPALAITIAVNVAFCVIAWLLHRREATTLR
ncbi:lysostaphin resistance A-like protein [Mariniluteicoccus flavus]